MKAKAASRRQETNGSLHPLVEAAIRNSLVPGRPGFGPLALCVPKTLRYLVTRADLGLPTDYTRVSKAIGVGNPQHANRGFASIGQILLLLQAEPRFRGVRFPDLTSIVTGKNKSIGGVGAFLSDPNMPAKSRSEKEAWIADRQTEVFNFLRWPEVLAYLGVSPMNNLSTQMETLERFAAQASMARGEGPEHLAMKRWVASNPALIVNQIGEVREASTEFLFWSLDRLDICLRTDTEWVGIEIKTAAANADEIRRGLYQVVKYRALLGAELLAQGSACSHRCLLALGGKLPIELRALASRLGVTPVENVQAHMSS